MRLSRRSFILAFSSTAMVTIAKAREYTGGVPWTPKAALPPQEPDHRQSYLTAEERKFLTAAVDRLIPEDDYPSASQAGVVDFIDYQLAGAFGRGDIYYLQGPFEDGLPTQGYQGEAPALLYRQAIEDIDKGLADTAGKRFSELSETDQDTVLKRLSEGEADLPTVDGKTFFDMLWQNTREGYFGDPVYGGNRDMAGWRMLGFPGARYDYRPWIDHNGQPVKLDPVSVAGYPQQGQ
ncbi:gluconate 2-dehydrogenase subunit 3 family protein [Tepidamorphus sp. 3E244]|uniref:gluconate 2-dehydrogenase subunit 3 family protein n=1 Tax=Tepidamorphus sp. 3E244 TaxID=3385498 RepID=UPI0038FC51DE